MEDIEYWWQSWRGKYYSRINGISTWCSTSAPPALQCSSSSSWLHLHTTWDLWSGCIIPASVSPLLMLLVTDWQTSIYSWVELPRLTSSSSLILLLRKLTWFAKISPSGLHSHRQRIAMPLSISFFFVFLPEWPEGASVWECLLALLVEQCIDKWIGADTEIDVWWSDCSLGHNCNLIGREKLNHIWFYLGITFA